MLYMFVYPGKLKLGARLLEKSQYVDTTNHTARNTHLLEEENTDKHLKLLLHLVTVRCLSWAGIECRILRNTKETTSSFNNDYMFQMNVTNMWYMYWWYLLY